MSISNIFDSKIECIDGEVMIIKKDGKKNNSEKFKK